MEDLSRKRTRSRLAERPEPYWHKLGKGAHLGFRAGSNTWIARFRDRAKKRHYRALQVSPHSEDEFIEAKRLAEDWFKQMGAASGGSAARGTVRQALEAYLEALRDEKRDGAAKLALSKFQTTVWNDRIAGVKLEDVSRTDFVEWRRRISKGKAPRTVNRYVRAVKAGLNRAHKHLQCVGNPDAWNLPMLSDDREDAATAILLSPAQRKAIIENANPQAAEFFRGLQFTGARPGELAEALVEDFNGKTLQLAHRKGKWAKRRNRDAAITPDGIPFFANIAKGKLPKALLFTVDGVNPWKRHLWSRAFRAAVDAHHDKCDPDDRIPVGASAYAFRHAFITEMLQTPGVHLLEVANSTGTSVLMIEKNYYRYQVNVLQEKLAAAKRTA